jgi:dihydrodipicolinate synthase/N-acetylneuraminate lyase
METNFYHGVIPALMTPCNADRSPNYLSLVKKAESLMDAGMSAVVYCGSMGDWPLLTDAQRQEGVAMLVDAGIPVIVGTGAQNTKQAAAHAVHAVRVGAKGLMLIPRVLSRGTSPAAQRAHFSGILEAANGLPSIIYNSPYYGFETKADLFFDLRNKFPHLVGFKEFGGADSLSYAAEHITSSHPDLLLLAGVDTQVFHGVVNCGAVGAITGIGNVIPKEILHYYNLCQKAASGDVEANRFAQELSQALQVLSTFDEGPDLVLHYKYLLTLRGESEYQLHFNETDELSPSQQGYAQAQLNQFDAWWADWPGCN